MRKGAGKDGGTDEAGGAGEDDLHGLKEESMCSEGEIECVSTSRVLI